MMNSAGAGVRLESSIQRRAVGFNSSVIRHLLYLTHMY
jgi:hypothetical protein